MLIPMFLSQREEILANRQRRKKQLEGLMTEARQQLADHTTGKRLLDSTDLAALEKKIHLYQRKLDTMEGDMDEREVYRYLEDSGKALLDIIALRCNMPTFRVASILLNMELKGVVRPLPGKQFELI